MTCGSGATDQAQISRGASTFEPVKTDPLFDAVDRLSTLLKRLWELRQSGEPNPDQTEAIDVLVDETVRSIMSLIRTARKTGSSQSQTSRNTSATVWKSFG